MFVLGHLGIGGQLLWRFARGRGERRWVYAGTLLPDVIDKPVYYTLAALRGRHGAALGLISGTRTFGHTTLFLLAVLLLGLALKRRGVVLLAAGVATHLVLDLLGDLEPARGVHPQGPSTLAAVLFPLLGPRFPFAHFATAAQHATAIGGYYVICGEVLGAALLLGQYLRLRRARE
jgi:hypothetical protein